MKKITYSMSYNANQEEWVVWKITKINDGMGSGGADSRCIFKGTKTECQNELNKLKSAISKED